MKKALFSVVFLFNIVAVFSQITNIEVLKVEEETQLVLEDEFSNNSTGFIINNGNITFNNLFNNAGSLNISPSSSTIVNGNYTSEGILEVTVNGAVAGNPLGYSQINVYGNLTLTSPTINVTVNPAYLPPNSTSHTIITYTGTLSGVFATVNIVNTSDNWLIDYSTSGEVNIIRASTLNIEDINKVNFIVYPNPTSEYINIESTIAIENIKLFDLLGKVLISTNKVLKIDVKGLTVGAYFLQIESKKGKITKKIIIE